MEAAIAWFNARKGKVTYSMTNRNGPNSYDCSSAVYHSLVEAGVFPKTIFIGNTDSLFGDLERHGWTALPEDANGFVNTGRGDVFIWGGRGTSSGGVGHTGEFIDANNIIHCCYGYNGIAISNHDWLWGLNGKPPVTYYHYNGAPVANNPTDQIVEVGSWIKFTDTYTANDVQLIDNTWQIKTDQLCKANFTWADNGIPAGLLTEVDGEGFATADQELAVGSLYKISGKFIVLDVGQTGSEWFAKVGAGGLTFWVDIETATEVTGSDAGTPAAVQKRAPIVVPPPVPTVDTPPVVEPPIIPPVVEPPVVIPPIVDPIVTPDPIVVPEPLPVVPDPIIPDLTMPPFIEIPVISSAPVTPNLFSQIIAFIIKLIKTIIGVK